MGNRKNEYERERHSYRKAHIAYKLRTTKNTISKHDIRNTNGEIRLHKGRTNLVYFSVQNVNNRKFTEEQG